MLVKSLSLFALAASALALPALPAPERRHGDWHDWKSGGKWHGGKANQAKSTDVAASASPSGSLADNVPSYAVAADDDDDDEWEYDDDEDEEDDKCPIRNKSGATATKTWSNSAATSKAEWSAPEAAATSTTLEHPVPSAEPSATEWKDESKDDNKNNDNNNLGHDLHAQEQEPTTTWQEEKAPEPTPDAKQDDNKNDNNNNGGGSSGGGEKNIGQATYYSVVNPGENHGYEAGTVACSSQKYSNDDDIVALSSLNYDSMGKDAVCGRRVGITNTENGKYAEATIVDRCAGGGCPWNALDLSPKVFNKLGLESQGILPIEWHFL